MRIIKSFQDAQPTLYIVATPIGNLADITLRAIDILKEVDIVFAEDTRVSGKLLKHYDINTHLNSVHEHNESQRATLLKNYYSEHKNIALISDAGTPRISDPGEVLVKTAIDVGYKVIPIPGATALITALMASEIATHPFLFYGFLPPKKNAREKTLETLKMVPYTLVFYEAPHRIDSMIQSLKSVFDNRRVTIAREMTKRYETFMHFELNETVDLNDLKGEMVCIVEGFKASEWLDQSDLIGHVELLIADGMKEMDAIKKVAQSRKMKKNDVYMAFKKHKRHFDSNINEEV